MQMGEQDLLRRYLKQRERQFHCRLVQGFRRQATPSMDGTLPQMARALVMPQVHRFQLVQTQLCMHSGDASLAQVVWQVLEKAEFNQER
jgi:hypothetical protein